jgi:hypothetical protein
MGGRIITFWVSEREGVYGQSWLYQGGAGLTRVGVPTYVGSQPLGRGEYWKETVRSQVL